MPGYKKTCPLEKNKIVDQYFLENRSKLMDIAAFLDRLERASGGADEKDDFRMAAFKQGLSLLCQDHESHRARRLLELFSDPSREPISSAAGLKGAHGACPAFCPKDETP